MRMTCTFSILVFLLVFSGCSSSPEDIGADLADWAISEARYQRLVGPSNRLLYILSSDFKGDRKREVEIILNELLEDVRNEIIKLDEVGIEEITAHETLPEIGLEIVLSKESYVIAVQGRNPKIEISSQLIEKIIYPFIKKLRELESGEIEEARDDLYGFLYNNLVEEINEIYLEPTKVEILEGLIFIIAHEVTHIWLDEVGDRTLESEIRADSYAILVSSELSLTADFRRKMMAGVGLTTEVETMGSITSTKYTYDFSDPVSIIMAQVRVGGDIIFDVYKDSKFSHGDATHLTIEERMVRVNEELEKILIKRAEDTTAMEAAFWAVSNDILFK